MNQPTTAAKPPYEQLVTVPITETEAQRKERMALGEPLPQFSYVAVGWRKS